MLNLFQYFLTIDLIFFYHNFLFIGIADIIFAYAMADKFNREHKDLMDLKQNLEQIVKRRTHELELAKEEVERMTREADSHRDEDRKRKEEIEVRNTADSAIYSAEKYLRELGDKVPANVRDDVNSKVSALRSALQGEDLSAIQKASDDLARALQAIGSSMYGDGAKGGPQQPPSGEQGPGDAGGSGDVVEGDFKQV